MSTDDPAAPAAFQDCARQGHGSPCYYCGQPCNSLAGNPHQWPIPLCHSDEPGKVKWHHIGCVSDRLSENATLRAQLAAAREDHDALRKEVEGWRMESQCWWRPDEVAVLRNTVLSVASRMEQELAEDGFCSLDGKSVRTYAQGLRAALGDAPEKGEGT